MIDLEQLKKLIREVVREELHSVVADLTVADYAARHSISRRTVWRAIKDGRLPAMHVGRVYRIPADATIGKPVRGDKHEESHAAFVRRLLGGGSK